MSKNGCVFDIKQFAVFDGPGIRTTVFLKGCPLRCMWCHNPEGLSFKPQLMVSHGSCIHCGACKRACPHPDHCVLCGACIQACPHHLRHIAGIMYTPEELATKLLRGREFLNRNAGGITFSGGEPTAQPEFLLEVLERLSGMHRAIETSGYCDQDNFKAIISNLDYIIMDIKMVDPVKHKYYTKADNSRVLTNLEILKQSGKPFRIRIPLIPGVNDDEKNLTDTAKLLRDARNLDFVELLPYHRTAGAKYDMVGLEYVPLFDTEREPNVNFDPFREEGIDCRTI